MKNKRDLSVKKSKKMQMDTIFNSKNTKFKVKEEDLIKDIRIRDAQTEIVSTPKIKLSVYPKNSYSTSNEEMDSNVKLEDSSKPEIKLSEMTGQLIQPHKRFSLLKNQQYTDNCYYYYHCRICNEKMPDFVSVIEHRKSIHNITYRGVSIKYLELEPDIFDVNNYCRVCELKSISMSGYRKHLRLVHHIILTPLKDLPKNSIAPDINDPNFYCCSCRKSFSTQQTYRIHLRNTHKIKLAPVIKKNHIIKNPDILPEWDNPDNYCRSCEFTFKSKSAFRRHCKSKHGIQPPTVERPDMRDPNFYCKVCNITFISRVYYRNHCRLVHPKYHFSCRIADPDVLPELSDPNNYCRACKKKLSNKYGYQYHLRNFHRMLGGPMVKKKLMALRPNINDPNLYCRACDKTLSRKESFRHHLLRVHSLGKQTEKEDGVQPDVNDPNYYCRVCKKTYKRNRLYRNHLLHVHKMVFQHSPNTRYNPDFAPDPLDPNFFCRVCKTTKKSLGYYRQHCREIHRMTLDPVSFPYPDAEIDINSPNFYCAKCNKHLKSINCFRGHLRRIHKLDPIKSRIVNPNANIDFNNPNFYCAKCDKHLATRSGLKYHVENVHQLTFSSASK